MMVLLFKKFSYLNKKPRNKLAFSILGKKEKLDIPCSANKLTHSRLNEKYYFIFFLLGNTMTVWFFFSTEQSCIICYGENRHADMNKKQYATKHSWENLTTHIHIHYSACLLDVWRAAAAVLIINYEPNMGWLSCYTPLEHTVAERVAMEKENMGLSWSYVIFVAVIIKWRCSFMLEGRCWL